MPRARSAECRCSETLTCGYCLQNAPPWFYTPRTMAEVIADEMREIANRQQERSPS